MKEIIVNNMDVIQSNYLKDKVLSPPEKLNKPLLANWVLVYQTHDDSLVQLVNQWLNTQQSQEYLAVVDACRRGQPFDLAAIETCPVCGGGIKFNNAWISQCEKGHAWGNCQV
jgi:hypothetical protein